MSKRTILPELTPPDLVFDVCFEGWFAQAEEMLLAVTGCGDVTRFGGNVTCGGVVGGGVCFWCVGGMVGHFIGGSVLFVITGHVILGQTHGAEK